MSSSSNKRITITLSNDIYKNLEFFSASSKLSKSKIIENALLNFDLSDKNKKTSWKKYSKAKQGRKLLLSSSDIDVLLNKLNAGCSVSDLAVEYNVSRQTVYNCLKNRKLKGE